MPSVVPSFSSVHSLLCNAGLAALANTVAEFSHGPCGEVRFGEGTSAEIGKMVVGMGKSRPLVVTDAGIAKAGHLQHILAALAAAGLEAAAFTDVLENPDTRVVDAVVAAAQAHGADMLIGLGGGSSMDAAKGANFLLSNGGRMQDYVGIGKAALPMLPFIAIPTTAGTGSECQSFALISDAETHVKMACGDKKAAARIALLDPLLTLTQPARVTSLTGIDALTHALESMVCLKANPISRIYSIAAFTLLARGFTQVFENPPQLQPRCELLAGAALAGVAIENSMLGAAHATANPLTAEYGVAHGAAVAVMMAPVLKLNLTQPEAESHYAALAQPYDLQAADLPSWWLETLQRTGIPTSLREHGVSQEKLPELAAAATRQWTGTFNPVKLDKEGFLRLYQEAW